MKRGAGSDRGQSKHIINLNPYTALSFCIRPFPSTRWGTQPVLELTIDSSKGRHAALGCLVVWIACFLLVLRPAFQSGGGSVVPGM
jgi:hypothetical protein